MHGLILNFKLVNHLWNQLCWQKLFVENGEKAENLSACIHYNVCKQNHRKVLYMSIKEVKQPAHFTADTVWKTLAPVHSHISVFAENFSQVLLVSYPRYRPAVWFKCNRTSITRSYTVHLIDFFILNYIPQWSRSTMVKATDSSVLLPCAPDCPSDPIKGRRGGAIKTSSGISQRTGVSRLPHWFHSIKGKPLRQKKEKMLLWLSFDIVNSRCSVRFYFNTCQTSYKSNEPQGRVE